MIEGHGNDIHQLPGLKMDFSSNVATRQTPEMLLRYLVDNLAQIATYPEADARTLRKQIAGALDVSDAQILVTNGSTEAFYLIATAWRQSRSLLFTPSFSEYEDACRIYGHEIRYTNITDFYKPFKEKTDIVWLGNPNNPDGTVTPASMIREKLETHPERLFVVDEAYGDLCLEFKSALPLLDHFDNLIVCRSMTKRYTIPGLRLGYIVTSETVANRLRKFMQPWNVNALAQAAGRFILQNGTKFQPDVPKLLDQSQKLQQQLSLLKGLKVQSSGCHFFLIRLLHSKASHLKTYLLQHHGMLLRDASNFHGLSDEHLRISPQSERENQALFLAIQEYLTSCK